MKIYFHIHLTEGHLTAVVKVTDGEKSLHGFLTTFCKRLKIKEKLCLDANQLEVFDNKKKYIAAETKLSKLNERDGFFVRTKEKVKCKVVDEKTLTSTQSSNATQMRNDYSPVVVGTLKTANGHLEQGRLDLALALYRQIEHEQNYTCTYGIARILFTVHRFKEALPYYEQLVNKNTTNNALLLNYGRILLKSGDLEKAVSVISRCINDMKRDQESVNSLHDANTLLANAFEAMGQFGNAFQIYLSVSQMTDKQHVDALLGYARVGYKIKQVPLDDVFIVLLSCFTHMKCDKAVKQLFAAMMMEEGSYESLGNCMQDAWSDAPALLFIANFLYEVGSFHHSKRLLDRAYSLSSTNLNGALQKLQLDESLGLFDDMMQFSLEFINKNSQLLSIRKVDISPFVEGLRLIRIKSNYKEVQLDISSTDIVSGEMSEVELKLIEFCLTVIRNCYVRGCLNHVSVFVKVFDSFLHMNLGKTLIGKELSFYSCISRVCPTISPPSIETDRFVYVLGAKHVLPLAWKEVTYNNQRHVLKPVLITHLQINHFCAGSVVYPLVCLETALKNVPSRSTCIFLVGRDNCGGWMQEAVQGCQYDSLEHCSQVLSEFYVKYLERLHKTKKLKIFVHPLTSVHKDICNTVEMLNESLKNRITNSTKLSWLCLTDALHADSAMDRYSTFYDIFLQPEYLPSLERCLNGKKNTKTRSESNL